MATLPSVSALVRLQLAGTAALGLSLLGFAKLAEDVRDHEQLVRYDSDAAGWLHNHTTAALTALSNAVTQIGSTHVIVAATLGLVALLLVHGQRVEAGFLACAVIGGEILDAVLKSEFHRARPEFADPVTSAAGFSFPSGHAMEAMILGGAVMLLGWPRCRTLRQRIVLGSVTGAVVLLVGMSRIYLGVHYPSDVAAGYAAGASWLLVCALTFSLWRSSRRTP